MSRPTLWFILPALALALWARPAQAQDAAQAEAMFTKAKRLMGEGRLAEACDAFAASEKLDPSPSTLMNLADCRDKNGQYASAWEAYVAVERRVRGDGRYGKMAEIASDRAARLEPRLSYLTINVTDDVRVDGLEVTRDGVVIASGAWNQALPIDGGTHVISGRAPGHEPWSTTATVAAEGDKQAVEIPKFKAMRAIATRGQTVIINRDAPSLFTRRRKIAVGVAAVGVAAVAAGLAFGLSSNRAADKATSLCPGVECMAFEEANRLNAQSRDRALYANIGFGVGAVAVAGAAIVWITGRPTDVRPRVTAQVGARQVAAAVELRF